MIPTRVYRLVPTAGPGDGNWGRAANQGEVVVRARSSGEARALAARAEARAAGAPAMTTTQVMASAFYDPVLYGARLDGSGAFPPEGPPGVLASANLRIPADYLLTHFE
jgi:hypothetical protein